MATAAMLLIAAVVRAQFGPGLPPGFAEALQPDFTSRDLPMFNQDLQLDEGQKPVLEALFGDYDAAFKKGADELRKSLVELDPASEIDDGTRDQRQQEIRRQLEELVDQNEQSEEGLTKEQLAQRKAEIAVKIEQYRQQLRELNPLPPRGDELQKALKRAGEHLETWRAERIRLRDEFVTNVQAVLKDDQKKLWPPLDRKLTREKTINRGRLSGESLDLFKVVNELHFAPEVNEAIKPVMNEYELRLDAALQARNAEIAQSQRDMIQATQNRDAKAMAAITERQMKTRVAVRDVNEETAAAIASKLPDALAATFTQTVKTRAYPRVYRSTQTQRVFSAAKELEGLDPSVRTSIESLEKAYLAELGPMNDHLRDVVKTSEPVEQVRRAERRGNGPAVSGATPNAAVGSDDPIAKAFAERNQLGQKYADQLKGVLTPEQWEKLPTGGNRLRVDEE